jgi:uncharacterized peroxidase-related enzyme
MTHFDELPTDADLGHVFRRFPKGIGHLLKYHDAVLRGPSDLSIGERELIAAYVSSLNACAYCTGAHSVIAETFGIDPELLQRITESPDAIDPKLKPLFNYVKKLTLTPSKILQEDAQAVYAVGFSDEALFDAISICALFNFMNRIVEGAGLETSAEARAATRERYKKVKAIPPTLTSAAAWELLTRPRFTLRVKIPVASAEVVNICALCLPPRSKRRGSEPGCDSKGSGRSPSGHYF